MSHPGEAGQNEELEFKWGQKRNVGGKNREVQFYASFTYDGVDYSLNDCVYMHHEEEGDPYIGKLIKIWETADKKKKVKIHWFFHSSEIINWLGDKEVHPNEIFLASGEGAGKTNVNDLEAIAGKCNVVCISKDSRNPQPSEQELQMADYVFHRTFDVRQCTILEKIDDIAGLEVQFLFNDPKLDSVKKDEPLEFKTERIDGNSNGLVPRKSLPDAKPASEAGLATASGQQLYLAGEKDTTHRMEPDKYEMKKSKVSADDIEAEDEGKPSQDSGALENKASKNPTADGSVKFSQSRNVNSKIKVNINNGKAMVTSTTTEKKPKTVPAKDILGSERGVKSSRDTGALDDRPSKKARVDCSVKVSANKNDIGGQKLSLNSERKKGKELSAPLNSGGVVKGGVSSYRPDKDPNQKIDKKTTKLIDGKLLNLSAKNCHGENRIPEGNTSQVTPKPVGVRGNWFRQLPWEERMVTAQEQGTLIQLSNLDPAYTSKQVEDIIWQALKEKCAAKMVQRNAISSPHSGQAFLILKTRGAAERIVRELDERCLMLSNRSPLVGRIVPPRSVQKKSAFFGHLTIDITRHQTQREWKEALSTSHYSQPNNIEYEMAIEWCLLQSRSKLWWNKFYKMQGEELRKLKANLKLK